MSSLQQGLENFQGAKKNTKQREKGRRGAAVSDQVWWGDDEETLEGAGARPGDTQPISSRGRGSRGSWPTGNRKWRGDRVLKEGAAGGWRGRLRRWRRKRRRRQNLTLKTQRNEKKKKIQRWSGERGGGSSGCMG